MVLRVKQARLRARTKRRREGNKTYISIISCSIPPKKYIWVEPMLLHVYVPKIFTLLFLVLQCTYVTVSMSELQVTSPLAGNCIRSDIWLPWVFSFALCLIVVFFIQIKAYRICRCRVTKFWGGAGGASHDTDVLCTNQDIALPAFDLPY